MQILPSIEALVVRINVIFLPIGRFVFSVTWLPIRFTFLLGSLNRFTKGVMHVQAHKFVQINIRNPKIVLMVRVRAGFAEVGGASDDDWFSAERIYQPVFGVYPVNVGLRNLI
ncbi:MAG: hypothetical protein WCE61_06780 [Candidatus Acidiferrum sp.]